MFTVTAHCTVITVWNDCSVSYLKHHWPRNMSTPTQRTSGTFQLLHTQQPLQIGTMCVCVCINTHTHTHTVWHFWLRISSGIKPWSTDLKSESLVTLHTEVMYLYHINNIQHLEPADKCSQLELCHWINSNPHMICNILFTNEAHFTCNGVNNTRNSHLWDRDNPCGTVESNYQHLFAINMWCGVIGDQIIGPYIFLQHLTGDIYTKFLQDELTALSENVPLQTQWQIYY